MSESSQIARPYARAVFEFAQGEDEKSLSNWQHALDLLAAITADAALARALAAPSTTDAQILEVVCETAAAAIKVPVGKLHPPFVNLIKLLVQNGRLTAAPDIAKIFAELCAEQNRTLEAQMTTATPIDEPQRKQFTAALAAKLDRKVNLEFAVDENLVGGAVVRAGDWVIDGSVRAQLEQLVGALRAQ